MGEDEEAALFSLTPGIPWEQTSIRETVQTVVLHSKKLDLSTSTAKSRISNRFCVTLDGFLSFWQYVDMYDDGDD